MVYMAGDNNLDSAGVTDLREMKKVGSDENIDVLAQFDRAGTDVATKRFYIRAGDTLESDVVVNLGETNCGDPAVLEDFILWGASEHPARHYLVVIWNHGQGWNDTNVYRMVARTLGRSINRRTTLMNDGVNPSLRPIPFRSILSVGGGRFSRALFSTTVERAVTTRAIALDDSARDFLDNLEMKKLFASVKRKLGRPIDILGMDACLMSMAEVYYQLRGSISYVVASEETEPEDGWPYDTVLSSLARRPEMTPQEVSALIVTKYLASYAPSAGVTQSACDLSKAEKIATAVDGLAKTLQKALTDATVQSEIMRARARVQCYEIDDYVDLMDFCTVLKSASSRGDIKSACATAIDTLAKSQFIVKSGYKGTEVANSTGLSIYFPLRSVSPLYARLDFARATTWGKFLDSYLARLKRR